MTISRFKGRLNKLEEKMYPGLPHPVIIVYFHNSLGSLLESNPVQAKCDGLTWHREVKETTEAFVKRVQAEAPQEKGRGTVIMMQPKDLQIPIKR